ncbi:hypothetical protein K1W54_22080 [Micromonospora sp. CPCC 205371]|nr:hypothetical protein [Micromonospora sp. CPCC 205371]
MFRSVEARPARLTRRAGRAAPPLLLLLLLGGCGSGGGSPSTSLAPTPSATLDPAVSRACADARTAIGDATARFSAALSAAVAAGEKGEAARQKAAMAELRDAFADWSTDLRARAGRAPDPALAAVLTEYAGAVDAVIARVRTPADLDRIYTFTETELDLAANRFAQVCPS